MPPARILASPRRLAPAPSDMTRGQGACALRPAAVGRHVRPSAQGVRHVPPTNTPHARFCALLAAALPETADDTAPAPACMPNDTAVSNTRICAASIVPGLENDRADRGIQRR